MKHLIFKYNYFSVACYFCLTYVPEPWLNPNTVSKFLSKPNPNLQLLRAYVGFGLSIHPVCQTTFTNKLQFLEAVTFNNGKSEFS